MAARENQGYLIAVIILVLLALVLALAAFLGLSKASENAEARATAEQNETYYKSLSEAERSKGEILKAMIGNLGPSINEYDVILQQVKQKASSQGLDSAQQQQLREIETEIARIKGEFDKDVEGQGTVGDDGVAKQSTYREALTNLINLAAKKVKDANIQTRETTRATEKAAEDIAQKQAELKSAQDEMVKLRGELEAEKQRSQENQNRLKDELAQSNRNLDALTRQYEDYKQVAESTQRGLQESINNLTEENQIVKAKLNTYEREYFVTADGVVTTVANSLKNVWVDLGAADGVTKNMTFSVYGKEVKNFDRGNSKASIEIIDVQPDRSIARITQQDPVNPILPGDQILTPTWDPGFPTKIALVGRFDIDGDKVDDTEKLARMIERNGGVVIAKHDQDGNISGAIDPTTRYLVTGNAPIIDGSASLSEAMNTIKAQADRNTVESIDLQKLLNRMGAKIRPSTTLIGLDSRGLTPRASRKSEDQ